MTDALYTACSKGDLHEVQSIIESALSHHKEVGELVNALDGKQKAAIHYAVQSGNINLVEYLLKNVALVDIKNSGGQTALHYAASLGLNDIILLLLKNRANINEKNKQGQTPLHYASQQGNTSTVELLITHGGYVNVFTTDQNTPLHFAVAYKHKDTVEMLLKWRAIVSVPILELETSPEIEEILENAISDPKFRELQMQDGNKQPGQKKAMQESLLTSTNINLNELQDDQ